MPAGIFQQTSGEFCEGVGRIVYCERHDFGGLRGFAENVLRYAADQLFATLDTTLRRLSLPDAEDIVLSDTVGFIRDLPHDLVAAFRATLKEAVDADLLLHVVDASQVNRADQIAAVDAVLSEIGADAVPQVLVLNKCDVTALAPRRPMRSAPAEPASTNPVSTRGASPSAPATASTFASIVPESQKR